MPAKTASDYMKLALQEEQEARRQVERDYAAVSRQLAKLQKMGPYSIGSDHWPGLSKLIEECGEVIQVAGKLVGSGGESAHWDGTDLRQRLAEELGDLLAAVDFVLDRNLLPSQFVHDRRGSKLGLFHKWDSEQGGRR